jgi:hypothetical protein
LKIFTSSTLRMPSRRLPIPALRTAASSMFGAPVGREIEPEALGSVDKTVLGEPPEVPMCRPMRLRSVLYCSCLTRQSWARASPLPGKSSSPRAVTENTSKSVPYASNAIAFTVSPSRGI